MLYRGRVVDVVSLWSEFCDFPNDVDRHVGDFLPKVKCPNPAHHTDKRHFQVNSAKPFVHCFARCGISGTWEHAIATIKGCTEKEARGIILKHCRVPTGGIIDHVSLSGTRKRIDYEDEVARDERAMLAGQYTFLPREAREYLVSRNISEHAILKWNIGYDEETGRIAIPGLDERQVFKFLIRRALGHYKGDDKYLYTPGAIKTNILFGMCYLDRAVLESVGLVLVEGSLDTIRFHEHGVGSTVGTLGSGLSRRQVRLIDNVRPRRVYCFYDKDVAGIDNIMDARAKITKYPLFVCRYPGDKEDPAELTRKEVWRQIERAIPIGEFSRNAKALTRR
jgi:hypothetical protein